MLTTGSCRGLRTSLDSPPGPKLEISKVCVCAKETWESAAPQLSQSQTKEEISTNFSKCSLFTCNLNEYGRFFLVECNTQVGRFWGQNERVQIEIVCVQKRDEECIGKRMLQIVLSY